MVDLVPSLGYERQPIAYGRPAFGASGEPDSGVPERRQEVQRVLEITETGGAGA